MVIDFVSLLDQVIFLDVQMEMGLVHVIMAMIGQILGNLLINNKIIALFFNHPDNLLHPLLKHFMMF